MTFDNSLRSQLAASGNAKSLDGTLGIARAGWMETTAITQQWTESPLIKSDGAKNYRTHRAVNLWAISIQICSKFWRSCLLSADLAAGLLFTTISMAGNCARTWRNDSRMIRLTRLRLTELPTLLFETDIPSLGPWRLGIPITEKKGPLTRLPAL
jgi:hypothetical protein